MAIVATFYKFVMLDALPQRRQALLETGQAHSLRGTLLLAAEGINGTLAGTREGIDAMLAVLRADPKFADLTHRESITDTPPFKRLKVKLKRELITMGVPAIDPSQQVGMYVPPDAWNDLIADPDVTVIDTRNAYEVAIGSFEGAQNPHLDSFRQFPDYARQQLSPDRHKKIAMFCTGGIRCEKASALLLQQGFEAVYHLQGGILNYLKTVPPEASLWRGECFVFDERVAVKHGLQPGSYELCMACGHPISQADQLSDAYVPNQSCPYCHTSQIG